MLEQLFGSKTRTKLLYLFYQYPTRPFYVREMAREIESQLNAVRREIGILVKAGLIGEIDPQKSNINNYDNSVVAKAKYYSLKTDCVFYLELKSLLIKGQELRERALIEKIKDKAGDIKLMILSGIFTDSADTATDIFLVGKIRPLVVARIVAEYEKKLSKPIRYTIMGEKEFLDRKDIGDRFLYSIFESKNIVAIDEL